MQSSSRHRSNGGLLTALAFLSLLGITGCVTSSRTDSAAVDAMSRDATVQLQIFLDDRYFGPGIVDGRPGEFTDKALALYHQSQGLAAGGMPNVGYIQPYTTYTVTSADLSSLGVMATEPAGQAQQRKLPYVSLAELLSERFHTTQAFLAELNPSVPVDEMQPGDVLRVPNVTRPLHIENFPSGYSRPPASVASTRRVRVDTHLRMLEVTEAGRLIAAFPITPGSAEHPAPKGEWKVVAAVPWPWYRYDEGVLKRGERTETFFNLPPGPNSPVGLLWTGLNRPGVGIHGTAFPETIGRSGSHGCIRLSNWDAASFYTMVQKGMVVTIE